MISILLLGILDNISFTYYSRSANSRTDRIIKKVHYYLLGWNLIFCLDISLYLSKKKKL